MAISDSVQGDILETWRDLMKEDIWSFNQVKGAGVYDLNTGVYLQPDRDMIGRALSESFDRLATYLGYYPRPVWITEEFQLSDIWSIGRKIFELQWGYLQDIGKRGCTLIQADVTVTYSNQGDVGINDLATITVTTAVDADEIAVFFRTGDGADSAASEQYQILPLKVTKSGNTATITGHRALFVKPSTIWQRPYENREYLEPRIADTQDAADFVTQVDVYRVYADASQAIEIHAPPLCNSCTERITYGTARVWDKRLSAIQLCNLTTICPPDAQFIRINYRAGLPLKWGKVNPILSTALVRLANTYMPYCVEAMSNGSLTPSIWGGKGAWAHDRESAQALTQADTQNPFGVMNGQVYAARVVNAAAIGHGGSFTAYANTAFSW